MDPGTGRCGFAAVRFTNHQPTILTYGCFEYPSKMPLPERYVELERDLSTILDEHKPSVLAIETLFFNRNVTTAMQVSEARGVITLCGAKRGISIQPCTPMQVKVAVTGYGKAEKKQVQQMIKLQLGLKELHKLDDAVDALAIAIAGYHLYTSRIN
ncbi:MAG TPA: crossover junction endodeoxyribonuclease RuvC [Patescibacteria group bacterium]